METNSIPVHFQTLGNTMSEFQIVFIHGAGSDSFIWKNQLENLSSEYFIVSYDLRGHGQSEFSGPIALEDHVSDLKKLAGALMLKNTVLVGMSLGGIVAQKYAESEPVRRLILVSSPAYSISGKNRILAEITKHISVIFFRIFWPRSVKWIIDSLFRKFDPETKEDTIRRTIQNGLASGLSDIRLLFDFQGADLDGQTAILYIMGENEDTRVKAHLKFLQKTYPKLKTRIVPEAYHAPNLENSSEFNRILKEELTSR